jgi:hypothetical protein
MIIGSMARVICNLAYDLPQLFKPCVFSILSYLSVSFRPQLWSRLVLASLEDFACDAFTVRVQACFSFLVPEVRSSLVQLFGLRIFCPFLKRNLCLLTTYLNGAHFHLSF